MKIITKINVGVAISTTIVYPSGILARVVNYGTTSTIEVGGIK